MDYLIGGTMPTKKKSLFEKLNEDIKGFRTTIIGWIAAGTVLLDIVQNFVNGLFDTVTPVLEAGFGEGSVFVAAIVTLKQLWSKFG